ncbi:unnamed protein product [Soboliphyme baturini]|uniref:non-specific serine/threonine protein kinase n=1 Tax=Soboliphyme baturini TaxID=241478 RepID=A0A183IGQ8_9BILA|nr:unnamed protein product [Soboliphyme baturini]
MGAQLSAAVPAISLSLERCISGTEDLEFLASLGSTRFMKVAKGMHSEGYCVIKVFIINDPSLPLKPYQSRINDIYAILREAPNCLPFSRTFITPKAAILVRQYLKDNLYDRLSTRPFLTETEKLWIAFQLLKALEQCHRADICHGDIKCENVLITSSTWTLLTDFANFKPSHLPYNNPTNFTYFFDTSRRRICYIAPERFVDTSDAATSGNLFPDDLIQNAKFPLLHSGDIFSTGCVLLELFSDGTPPFDFSQLLAYRERRYYPDKVINTIKCAALRELVQSMIQLEVSQRLTAEQYLDKYRLSVFPEIFYSFLWPYLKSFVEIPILSDDDKAKK